MNDRYLDTIRYYANKLLSPTQLQAIRSIPLFGENGIRKWLASRSLEAFIHLYFPDEFTLPLAPIHHQMLDDMQQVRDRQVSSLPGLKLARAIPRGHSKSTYYSRLLPLHGFLFAWSPLTVLLGNNDDSARRLVGNIKTAIETNPLILEDFPNIKGSVWGIERLENNTGGIITGYGVGSGAVRGISTGQYRPSLVILDDIDDEKSVRSAVELAHNKEWFDKSVMPLGAIDDTTSFIMVGTIIRKTSLLKYVIDGVDFSSIVEPAIKNFASNDNLWQQWQDNILDMAREGNQPKDASEDTFYQANKQEMLAGVELLWNRHEDYYRELMLRKLRNSKAFYSEYQNNPQDTESIFGSIPYINLSTIDESEYDLLAALDPTTTGKKSSDLAAYVEVLFHRKRKEMIVSYVDAKQRSYGQTIDAVTRRIKSRGRLYQGFWVEDNSAGLVIKDLINDKFKQERIQLVANGIYNTLPKADRIGALSEYMERGQLLFADNLPPEMADELAMYPMVHDDILDAISTVALYLKDKKMLDLIQLPPAYGSRTL